MPTLLVIDDDLLVLKTLELALADADLVVTGASSAAAALTAFAATRPDAVLCDIRLPDSSGLDLLSRLKQTDPAVPVVLMTGYGTAETAIEAMRRGAFDYVLKPLDPDRLTEVVRKALEVNRLMRVPPRLDSDPATDDDGSEDRFIGHSVAMQEVFKAIGRVAPTDATVLILGESGTGKEMVARAVYHYSRRAGKPFQAFNCAAVPDALLESELFGHEKGAFTGADRRRIGRFEQCHGGTIFLDEIGDMTALTQAKVLRLLQDQRFERVGGNDTIQTDVRLIAATHRDLEAMVAAGTFREDLYYRLNVCPIRLPALRDRPEDLVSLATHFARRYGREYGKPVTTVGEDALAALRAFPWPGNVRQLQSVIRQAVLKSVGPTLTADALPNEVCVQPRPAANGEPPDRAGTDTLAFIRRRLREGSTNLHAELVGLVERQLLTEVLTETDGNLTRTAAILGVTRPTLRARMAALGITVDCRATVKAAP